MKTISARFLALFVFLLVDFPALAEAFIRSYHSVVELAADGKLTVTETIPARAEGQNIKHGIFRDFPLYALDANNRRTKVDFNVVSVEHDGAPTPLGRKLMDGIEGLRTYLTLAEKDRMNMAGVPVMSLQHFETLLPYAVALGVEKPWSPAPLLGDMAYHGCRGCCRGKLCVRLVCGQQLRQLWQQDRRLFLLHGGHHRLHHSSARQCSSGSNFSGGGGGF